MQRSDFIKIVSLAGGGLIVAAKFPLAGEFARAAHGASLTAWVQITPDNFVTIMSPQSEMGQGVMTSIPMLIAEELDADWSRVKVEQSSVDPVFNNPLFGEMVTGSSTSVRAFFTPARTVGATARELLVAAAAREWGVPSTQCRTNAGVVYHEPSGKKATYGSLASSAATIRSRRGVTLKPRNDWKIIGQATARVDALAKSTGAAVFGIDVRIPGMMFAAIQHSPVFGGTVASIDETSLAKFEWPHQVVNLENAVAVVSDRTWRALKAASSLMVRWNKGPGASLNDARITASLHDCLKKRGTRAVSRGNAAAALNIAAKVIEAEYRVPFLAHATMEPINITASVTPHGCEIWAPTQGPSSLAALASRLTNLPRANVTVHTTFLGGGFGRKFAFDYPTQAIKISKAIGRPVQLVWSREEDIQHDMYRPTALSAMSAGLDAFGNIVAWQQRIVSPSIVYQNLDLFMRAGIDALGNLAAWRQRILPPWVVHQNLPLETLLQLMAGRPDPTSTEGASDNKYAIPNFLLDVVTKNTGVPVWFWRSVGHSYNAFFFESFLDEVAQAAAKDPYEFRRALLKDEPRQLAVLDMLADKSAWGQPLAKGHGRGIAIHESFGSIVGQVAEVSVESDALKVPRVTCVIDCGTVVNPDTVRAQIEGGIIFGLTAALFGEIGIEDGRVQQKNFWDHRMVRLAQSPRMDLYIVPSTRDPGGVGEVGTPPIAPAVANAIFAATGKRVRTLPFVKSGFTVT